MSQKQSCKGVKFRGGEWVFGYMRCTRLMRVFTFGRCIDHLFDGSLREHTQLEDKDWDLEKQRDLINTNPLKQPH